MTNLLLNTDSYKASHYLQYPPYVSKINSYIESRGIAKDSPIPDKVKPEIVHFGLQAFIKEYLLKPITQDNITEAEEIFTLHGEPFNYTGWTNILNKHGGYLPLEIESLPEGLPVPIGTTQVQIRNTDPDFAWLTSYIETSLLRAIWYPSTVATVSREVKKVILEYLNKTSDDPHGQIMFKLHDFGSRGVSSNESAMLGGMAHLVNFLGTDTTIALVGAKKYYNESMAGFSIPACFDDKTEILTNKGFIQFDQLSYEHKIGSYDINGKIIFEFPSKIHKSYYEGNMIRFKSNGKLAKVDLLVTPNHRIVKRSFNSNNIEIQYAEDVIFSNKNAWIHSGETSVIGDDLSPLEQLYIAFQADGSFPSRKNSYNGNKHGTIPIRFSLKKERKKERLQDILNKIENCNFKDTGEYNKPGYSHYWITLDKNINISKDFSWVNATSRSSQWCKSFLNELSYWDGNMATNNCIKYATTNLYNATVVQLVGTLAGWRTNLHNYIDKRGNRKPLYEVLITKTNCRIGNNIQKYTEYYKGNIHCVTVSTGMVIVKRNGIVSVSGNSEHSTMTSWGEDNESQAYMNMLNKFAKPGKLVAVVSDSYNIYKAASEIWGTELKEQVINSGATIVIRPDSGNPIVCVLSLLNILGERFGFTYNKKGYKVLHPSVRLIQGDGINYDTITEILKEMLAQNWSADNVAFGMGGALLQKVNRDTFKYAMKANAKFDGTNWTDVYKNPITDSGKISKAGILSVTKNGTYQNIRRINLLSEKDLLQPVYRDGLLLKDMNFSEVRNNAKI